MVHVIFCAETPGPQPLLFETVLGSLDMGMQSCWGGWTLRFFLFANGLDLRVFGRAMAFPELLDAFRTQGATG